MLKKTSAITAYNSLQCCSTSAPHSLCASSTSPLLLPSPRARPDKQHARHSRWRAYATVRDSKGPDFRDNMNWPCRKASPSVPSPYEIFELERGTEYSKAVKYRYYEMVKMYHPDKSIHNESLNLSHMERLERYRLVVQAHEILSDPVKRKAYDAYGAGWGERTVTRHSKGYSNGAGTQYGHGENQDASPFANATWEDWERWYRTRDDQHKQAYAGTYVNPNAFASFVIILAVLTGVLQATRVSQYSSSVSEKVQAFTEETNEFLNTRAQHLSENRLNSDGRVRHFLERRDPTKYGLKDEEEATYRKHFAPAEHHLPPKPETNAQDD